MGSVSSELRAGTNPRRCPAVAQGNHFGTVGGITYGSSAAKAFAVLSSLGTICECCSKPITYRASTCDPLMLVAHAHLSCCADPLRMMFHLCMLPCNATCGTSQGRCRGVSHERHVEDMARSACVHSSKLPLTSYTCMGCVPQLLCLLWHIRSPHLGSHLGPLCAGFAFSCATVLLEVEDTIRWGEGCGHYGGAQQQKAYGNGSAGSSASWPCLPSQRMRFWV